MNVVATALRPSISGIGGFGVNVDSIHSAASRAVMRRASASALPAESPTDANVTKSKRLHGVNRVDVA